MHKRPREASREDKVGLFPEPAIWRRIEIMGLDLCIFWAAKIALACYIDDRDVNIAILTGANVVPSSITRVDLPDVTRTNDCRSTQGNVQRGGGGGALISICHASPCLPATDSVGGGGNVKRSAVFLAYP